MRLVLNVLLSSILLISAVATAADVIDLGNQRELFVDRHLIAHTDQVRLELLHPQPGNIALTLDAPWEYAASFFTIIKDQHRYRMYYRGGRKNPTGKYDPSVEFTCYAEGLDGITWTKPALDLHPFDNTPQTNIILTTETHGGSHNFSPMLDNRPEVSTEERFKAVGGEASTSKYSPGLNRYVSADGIHWRKLPLDPLFPGYALDSHNVLVWLPGENCYAIYLRTWSEGGVPTKPQFKGFRTISRSTSKDFITWTEPEPMTFGGVPPEHLYTNNTQPYFRAPQLLISLPFRLFPRRQVYPRDQQVAWGVSPAQARGLSDAVFMTSRGGTRYDRTFLESFIRPGRDPRNWHARDNQPALGIVPTPDGEISLFVNHHYTAPTAHLRRYTLRPDGFVAARAGYTPGTLLTKPLTFRGTRLQLNFSTSAAGSVRVELLDTQGAILATSEEMIGDETDRVVTWTAETDLAALADTPVQIRFTLKDADLFSFQFTR